MSSAASETTRGNAAVSGNPSAGPASPSMILRHRRWPLPLPLLMPSTVTDVSTLCSAQSYHISHHQSTLQSEWTVHDTSKLPVRPGQHALATLTSTAKAQHKPCNEPYCVLYPALQLLIQLGLLCTGRLCSPLSCSGDTGLTAHLVEPPAQPSPLCREDI